MAKVSPSLLSADFSRLGEQVKLVEKYSDQIHFDVMDGHFVPNITCGPAVLQAVRRSTRLPIEAHLMISNPSEFIEDFAKSGADIITVHIEADRHIHRTLNRIRGMDKKPGVSLNPSTPVSAIEYVLEEVDQVLVMTVNPGFGGQKFIESMLPKIRKLKELIRERGLQAEVEVDGGINAETAKKATAAGADILVAGSYIFNSKDPIAAIKSLKGKQ
ncbi:ribulose-phosphate 3-epimerase [Candidatus Woesearchaeota archaeon]|nr:ribulose-phosphate 3-epimerase [Candidatus Woesearchaeota archaeon]